MATNQAESDRQDRMQTGGGTSYTRVAMYLHWAIAILIFWNLVSGLLIWDLAEEFFKANRPLYFLGLTLHMSAGMTVLALTVGRIVWRLMHEPPAYPANMKAWERHSAHFAHFLLYAGMLLMPLTGWGILSAHPPAGSPGQQVERAMMAATMGPPAAGAAAGSQPAGPPAGPPGGKALSPPGIWFVIPMPVITPLAEIGREPGGVKPLIVLHDEIVEWHEVGAYLMLLLLFLHIAGALKHQLVDKEPELQRMGLGKRRLEAK